jgi:hypothetical protein
MFDIVQFQKEHLEMLGLRMETLSKAVSLSEIMGSQDMLDLSQFYPQTIADVEAQNFNIFGQLPLSIINKKTNPTVHSSTQSQKNNQIEEELMMWFLEKDNLRRDLIAQFLLQPSTLSRQTLSQLLHRICSLEIAQGFAEGLKYFFVVSGLWEEYVALSTINNDSGVRAVFRTVVMQYVQTHFLLSKKPLLACSGLTDSQLSILVDVTFEVLQAFRSLYLGKKASTVAMSEFNFALRSIFKNTESSLREKTSLSNKAIMDLFQSISSAPIVPLKVPSNIPSFIFASCIRSCSDVAVSFDNDFQATPRIVHVKLGKDALYLFQQQQQNDVNSGTNNSSWCISAVIPLSTVFPQRCSYDNNQEVFELLDLEGKRVMWLDFEICTTTVDDTSYRFFAPSDIKLFNRIVLDFSQANDRTTADGVMAEGTEDFEVCDWFDQLENCCWECRSRR